MIHWIESEDERGFPIWLRYIDCGPWGLVLTGSFIRWASNDRWLWRAIRVT